MVIDLLIIGGGINGVGIAADAAGRGLRVLLCEQGDLASATSSKSSKLIHGGLRYLEHYEFRLVKEALQEREILLKKAPHIIHPLQFILPHNPQLKPAWMLRLGLFIYDHLGKRHELPKSQTIRYRNHRAGQLLKEQFSLGFSYYDCQVDDARLVVLNALQARQLGADIRTRTRVIAATRSSQGWEVTLENTRDQTKTTLLAHTLINATGPWVDSILQQTLHLDSMHHITGVKGSHIVIPKLYPEKYAFILINADKRVIFVIPYLQHFSLIGTTDIPFQGDPAAAQISPDEVRYLCDAVNHYFRQSISPNQVIWSYAGVRPLHNHNIANSSEISRDYFLELNASENTCPLLSVFGGKITTYRKLAEHALAKLAPFFPKMGPAWTTNGPLPGGNIPNQDIQAYHREFSAQYPWLSSELATRYVYSYGSLAQDFLQERKNLADLGRKFGADLYQCEIDYLMQKEWAQTAEDILWRRSKVGLFFPVENLKILENYINDEK